MEILSPYVKGLNFLFYTNHNGLKKLSLFKLFFLLTYIFSIFTAFFQFMNLTSNDLVCEVSKVGEPVCSIKFSTFGTLFNISSLVLILGAFIIFFYSSLINKPKTLYTYVSLILSGSILVTLLSFFIVFLTKVDEFNIAFNAVGYAIILIWVMIFEPILFFTGVLILLDIITQDYELKGFSKKTNLFLLFENVLMV